MATASLAQMLANPAAISTPNFEFAPVQVNPGQMVQAPPPMPEEQGGDLDAKGVMGLAGLLQGGGGGPTLDAAGILDKLPSSGVPVGIAKPELIQQEKNLLGLNTFEGYDPLATGINGQSGSPQLPLFMQQ